MRDKIQFSGRVEGGKVVPSIDRWVDAELGKIEGEAIFITLEPIRNRRSLKQNRWYWGCLIKTISEETGQDPESLHEFFKSKFLSEKFLMTNSGGEIIDEQVISKSTTRLSIMAFSEYIMAIEEWAGTFLQITIPEADHANSL